MWYGYISPWFLDEALKQHLHQVMKWYNEDHIGLDMLPHYDNNVGGCTDHVCQILNTPRVMTSSPTPQTYSAIILVFALNLKTVLPSGGEVVQGVACIYIMLLHSDRSVG